jgi:hypothetical protein
VLNCTTKERQRGARRVRRITDATGWRMEWGIDAVGADANGPENDRLS